MAGTATLPEEQEWPQGPDNESELEQKGPSTAHKQCFTVYKPVPGNQSKDTSLLDRCSSSFSSACTRTRSCPAPGPSFLPLGMSLGVLSPVPPPQHLTEISHSAEASLNPRKKVVNVLKARTTLSTLNAIKTIMILARTS